MKKEDILKATCDYYQITIAELFKRSRKTEVVSKRQIFTYLLLIDSIGTLESHVVFIFKASGQRYTHPTLIYSRDSISANRKAFKGVEKDITEIRNRYPKKIDTVQFQNATRNISINYTQSFITA